MSKTKKFSIKFFFLLTVIFLLNINIISAKEIKSHKILILNSYHEGLLWTDDIMEGIKKSLKKSGIKNEIFIEYMDTKRNNPDKITGHLEKLYKTKYSKKKFDIIISSDNNALDFLLKSKEKLFPGVPIVFCGYNNFENSILEGHKNITGVTEEYDLKGNVELAKKLHPGLKHIALISDVTPTGRINLKLMKKVMPDYEDSIEFIELTALTIPALKKALNSLPPETVVFNLAYYRTPDGNSLSLEESSGLIVENCSVPVYSSWDYMINYGTLGGIAASGKVQGEKAAEIAVRILKGEAVKNIPVLSDNINIPIFDYNQLKRFKIRTSSLPEGSIIINRPKNFYNQHPILLLLIILFLFIQSIIILFLFINIIRRKEAEREVKKSEHRYRMLVENAPLGIISVNKDGTIIDVNPKLLKILGSPSLEKTRNINILNFSPLVESGITDDFLLCLKKGNTIISERLYKSLWGKEIHLRYHLRPTKNNNNQITGVQGIIEEMTEQKKMERELRQAQKMEAIGRLAGGIAHDFNNILSSIIGYTDLIFESNILDPDTNHHLLQIIKASQRAKEVVRQILTFGRKTKFTRKPVVLSSIVKEVLKLMNGSIEPEIKITVAVKEENMIVLADPTQMHRLIMNLCTNACQAMKEKGGALEISLEGIYINQKDRAFLDLKAGHYIKLMIKDTGCGIEKENIEHIFEPYFTTKEHGEGSGWGLAVVHGIITSHKGKITVESEEGKGTLFHIYLPRIEYREERKTGVIKHPSNGKKRILWVDDEEDLIYIAKVRLEKIGYKVTAKENSLEALKLFQKEYNKFDLVITDQMMPGLKGNELAEKILALRPDIPVILCTGFSNKVTPEKAKEMGISDFIMKPFDMEDIAVKVRSILN